MPCQLGLCLVEGCGEAMLCLPDPPECFLVRRVAMLHRLGRFQGESAGRWCRLVHPLGENARIQCRPGQSLAGGHGVAIPCRLEQSLAGEHGDAMPYRLERSLEGHGAMQCRLGNLMQNIRTDVLQRNKYAITCRGFVDWSCSHRKQDEAEGNSERLEHV